MSAPTEPLPPAAVVALESLELRVTAVRYLDAADNCRALAQVADFDGCLAAQDEMAFCRCRLEQAGRLDLIGGAA